MKKVIFSAIAMIAFVGSSMANDIAEKEVTVENLQKISVQETVSAKLFRENCDLVKFRIYNLAIDLGYDSQLATSYSYKAYFNCVSKNLSSVE
jgi:hypothetical protein